MKLGLQISMTGLVVMLAALMFVRGKWPGPLVGLPLIISVFGGFGAIVGGVIMMIWSI